MKCGIIKKIINHIDSNKSFYEIVLMLAVVFFSWGVHDTSREALRTTKESFKMRNRPYVIIGENILANIDKYQYKYSVQFEL